MTSTSNYALNPARLAAQQDYNPALIAVDYDAIQKLVVPEGLKGMGATLEGPLAADPALFVPYFVAMDTMNYQFWDVVNGKDFVRYGLNGKVGALAMQEAFHAVWYTCFQAAGGDVARAVETLRDKVEQEGVAFMFGDIPAAQSRKELLLEVLDSARLAAITDHLVRRCKEDKELSWQDAKLLADTFPRSYADRYLKKAQLTLMFIAGQWASAGFGDVSLEDISAAADYQLPKVLRSLGLLTYSAELAAIVDSGELVFSNSPLERAIRAATILACDALAKLFGCSIGQVDFWLWLMRNLSKEAMFHRTPGSDY